MNAGKPLLLHTLKSRDYVWAAAFTRDNLRVAVGCKYLATTIWSTETGALLHTIDKLCSAYHLVFNSPGTLLACLQTVNAQIAVYKVSGGAPELLHHLPGHLRPNRSLAFSPRGDSTLASASDDTVVRVWDTDTGACSCVLRGHTGSVYTAAYSSDGARIVTGSDDRRVKVWRADDGVCLYTVGTASICSSAVFSPDDSVIGAGCRGEVLLLDARSGTVLRRLERVNGQVDSMAFDPCGRVLTTVSAFTSFKVWDTRTGMCLATLHDEVRGVTCGAVSPDGSMLAVATDIQADRTTLYDISAFSAGARVLALVLIGRRHKDLPHVPPELWCLIADEFF